MGLVHNTPIGSAPNEVQHQVLTLRRPVGKDRAAVNGSKGRNALTPGMQLPKPCSQSQSQTNQSQNSQTHKQHV